MISFHHFVEAFILNYWIHYGSIIATAAFRTCVLAALAGVGLRLARVRDVSIRHATWSLVLAAGLVMPLVSNIFNPMFDPFVPAVRIPALESQVRGTLSALRTKARELRKSWRHGAASSGNNPDGRRQQPSAIGMPGAIFVHARARAEILTELKVLTRETIRGSVPPGASSAKSAASHTALSTLSGREALGTSALALIGRAAQAGLAVWRSQFKDSLFIVENVWGFARTNWLAGVALAYGGGALWLFSRVILGLILGRRLALKSALLGTKMAGATCQDNSKAGAALSELKKLATRAGVRQDIQLRASEAVSVPGTTGLVRPVILLPDNWHEWELLKMKAVLAHETSHIRRNDFAIQTLAGVYRAVFWFSPLSWWVGRKLADLADEAADDFALSATENRIHYAETLLGFMRVLSGAGAGNRRVQWELVAMTKKSVSELNEQDGTCDGGLKPKGSGKSTAAMRRLERILAPGRNLSKGLSRSLRVALASAAMISVIAVSALRPAFSRQVTARPTTAKQTAPQGGVKGGIAGGVTGGVTGGVAGGVTGGIKGGVESGVANGASIAEPAEVATSNESQSTIETPSSESVNSDVIVAQAAPTAPGSPTLTPDAAPPAPPAQAPAPAPASVPAAPRVPERTPKAPKPAKAPRAPSERGSNWYHLADGEQGYVIVSGDGSVTMSWGGSNEAVEARKLRSKISGDYIWFRRNGKAYVIDDPAVVASAKKLYEPMHELGRKQAELGKQQAKLGEEQAKYGDQMAKLGEEMSRVKIDIPPDLERQLKEIEKTMPKAIDEKKLAELQALAGQIQAKMAESEGQFAELQSKIAKEQGLLGGYQGKLGAQQGELGREQGKLGAEQGRLAQEADQKIQGIIDDAVKKGTAKKLE